MNQKTYQITLGSILASSRDEIEALLKTTKKQLEQALQDNDLQAISNGFDILTCLLQCDKASLELRSEVAKSIADLSEMLVSPLPVEFQALSDEFSMLSGKIYTIKMLAKAMQAYSTAIGDQKEVILAGINNYIEQHALNALDAVNGFDDVGNTLLHMAIKYKLPMVSRWVLQQERARTQDFLSQLAIAESNQDKLLLIEEAFFNKFSLFETNSEGLTPIKLAFAEKDSSSVYLLLAQEQIVSEVIARINIALQSGNINITYIENNFPNILTYWQHMQKVSKLTNNKDTDGVDIFNAAGIFSPAKLIAIKFDNVIGTCRLMADWRKFYDLVESEPYKNNPLTIDIVTDAYARAIITEKHRAAAALAKTIENNAETMSKSPALTDLLYYIAHTVKAGSIYSRPIWPYLNHAYNFLLQLGVSASINRLPSDIFNLYNYNRATSEGNNILHITLEAENYNFASSALLDLKGYLIEEKNTLGFSPVVNAVKVICANRFSSNKTAGMQRLRTFLLGSEIGKEAYIRGLSDLLYQQEEQHVRLFLKLKDNGKIAFDKEILQLSTQYNVPNVAQWLCSTKDIEGSDDTVNFNDVYSKAVYFSVYTRDLEYLDHAIRSIPYTNPGLMTGVISREIDRFLPDIDDDALKAIVKLLEKYNIYLYNHWFFQQSALQQFKEADASPAFIAKLKTLRVTMNLVDCLGQQGENAAAVTRIMKAGLYADAREYGTNNTILHKLIVNYSIATASTKRDIQQCIKTYLNKEGAKALLEVNARGVTPLALIISTFCSADQLLARGSLLNVMAECVPPKMDEPEVYNAYAHIVFQLAEEGDYINVSSLITAGFPVSYVDPATGNSLLHELMVSYRKRAIALKGKHKEDKTLNLIKICIKNCLIYDTNTDLSYKNKEGDTPITLIRNKSLLELFIEVRKPDPADSVNYQEWKKALYDLIVAGNFTQAQLLLEANVHPTYIDKDGNTILHKAVTVNGVNDLEIQMLLSYYPDIFHLNNAWATAAKVREKHVASWMWGASSIRKALETTENKKFANFPRDGEAHNNTLHARGGNALHGAVQANNPNLVIALLNKKVDATKQNQDGWSPLRFAVKLAHWDCVKVLIPEKLITDDEKYIYGEVLYWAVCGKQDELIDILLAKGASLNWKPVDDTPFIPLLHIAVASKDEKLLLKLLDQPQVNLSALDPAERTAYEFAQSLNIETDAWQVIVDRLDPDNADNSENIEFEAELTPLTVMPPMSEQAREELGSCSVYIPNFFQAPPSTEAAAPQAATEEKPEVYVLKIGPINPDLDEENGLWSDTAEQIRENAGMVL